MHIAKSNVLDKILRIPGNVGSMGQEQQRCWHPGGLVAPLSAAAVLQRRSRSLARPPSLPMPRSRPLVWARPLRVLDTHTPRMGQGKTVDEALDIKKHGHREGARASSGETLFRAGLRDAIGTLSAD